MKVKMKWFGTYAQFTVAQIAILRLIPFFHYHLLNACLMERKPAFRDYVKNSILTNIPLAFFYTVFGEFITAFNPSIIVFLLICLTIVFHLLREKMVVIKWTEFFQM